MLFQMFIANKVLIANKVSVVKSSDEYIEKSVEPKIRKLSKTKKLFKSKKLKSKKLFKSQKLKSKKMVKSKKPSKSGNLFKFNAKKIQPSFLLSNSSVALNCL